MSTDDEEHAVVTDAVDAVREALGKHHIMATRIVILAEAIEPNGDVALWSAVDDDLKPWHALGMLTCAIQREQAGMIEDDA